MLQLFHVLNVQMYLLKTASFFYTIQFKVNSLFPPPPLLPLENSVTHQGVNIPESEAAKWYKANLWLKFTQYHRHKLLCLLWCDWTLLLHMISQDYFQERVKMTKAKRTGACLEEKTKDRNPEQTNIVFAYCSDGKCFGCCLWSNTAGIYRKKTHQF